MPRPAIIDRALRAVGLQRASASRPRIGASWQGGESSRLTASWNTPTASINHELRFQLQILRARSRWLVENNGYAEGFARAVADNMIGPKGIQLRAENRTRSGQFVATTNDAIEFSWSRAGTPANFDVARRLSRLDLERLVARTVAVDGEALVRIWRGFGNADGFAAQMIDTDLLDENYNVEASVGQNQIRMSVELDVWGGAVAYHLLTSHPAEMGGARTRVRVPASDLLHLFVPLRAGQIRGVPWLAPVLTDMQMLDGYEEAELVAARTAATQMGLLKPNENAPSDTNGPAATEFSAEPGQFRELPYGYDIEQWNPQHPNNAFAAFCDSILRCIARGAGVTYMTLTGDLSSANYSSLRAGQGPERDAWRGLQQWMIPRLHDPMFEAWLPYALLSGRIAVDSRLASNYESRSWKPRGWQSVDPLKDLQAAERRIALGVGSRTRLCAEEGEDYESIIDELADEQRYAEQEGVDISGIDAQPPVAGATDVLPMPNPADAATPLRRPAMREMRRRAAGDK